MREEEKWYKKGVATTLEEASPKAIHLLDIAEKRSRQNLLKEPEEFLPIYLNDENSWKKLK